MTPDPGGPADATGDAGAAEAGPGNGGGHARFRTTLVRVLLVQAVALALLGLLQSVYHS